MSRVAGLLSQQGIDPKLIWYKGFEGLGGKTSVGPELPTIVAMR